MKIHVEPRDGAQVAWLSGTMTGGDDRKWVDSVTALVDETGAFVVLELSEVSYISSAALGDLVRITALANTQGARLVLANPSPFVAGVMKTTRLDKFFDIHETLDKALIAR